MVEISCFGSYGSYTILLPSMKQHNLYFLTTALLCLVSSFQVRRPVLITRSALLSTADKLEAESIVVDVDNTNGTKQPPIRNKRKMELQWCNSQTCQEALREKVVGEHNHMELTAPATGQVAYSFVDESSTSTHTNNGAQSSPPAVLILVKPDDDELVPVAVEVIQKLMSDYGVQILIDSIFREKLSAFGDRIDLESTLIRHFEPKPVPGFGSGKQLLATTTSSSDDIMSNGDNQQHSADLEDADLIVTLGGDGTIMYASHIFSGPVPPILPIAGGSMGFLTPFAREEMLEAVLIALGLKEAEVEEEEDVRGTKKSGEVITPRPMYSDIEPLAFGNDNQICISMRMRLDCRIFASDGSLIARYAVLNEVVIDRGSSPYLASLECFCDDVHLTTVQADGIIFATPTGSTAYSMAAGGSVVHPAVPAIMVTPICPHVLSFRSMVFPDHVVLRCYVPTDARSTACVYFDGKHRTELSRGDSVQIEMSSHPVPTINRADHSADWLSSLKSNFNFNTRVRQKKISTTSVPE